MGIPKRRDGGYSLEDASNCDKVPHQRNYRDAAVTINGNSNRAATTIPPGGGSRLGIVNGKGGTSGWRACPALEIAKCHSLSWNVA
jgi:hypothetical protein